MAVKRLLLEINTGKFNAPDKILVRMNTRSSPIKPPMRQRKADSNKNSVRIILLLAPTAFFRPIWLVRSRTDTNIILATPNIPTKSDIPAMIHPPVFNGPKMLLTASLKSLISFNAKSSSWVGLNLWIAALHLSDHLSMLRFVNYLFPVQVSRGLNFWPT